MRVSLDWLRELVDFDTPPETLAEMLSFSGTKVESIDRPAEGLAGVVIAEVVDVTPHPDADNLLLVEVRTDSGSSRVVCGASNFAPGDRVPLARVGAHLPGMEISARKIRGQVSEGMLCSGSELGVSKDHSGILVLPPDAPLGEDVVAVLGLDDTILVLELTLNRPDCTGMIGVAREVAALVGSELRFPDASAPGDASLAAPVSVTIEDPGGCSRYVARYLEDITIAASPHPIQARLLKAGIRPISNVVDVTNFVLMETGHPLHAFDGSLVADRAIHVRRAQDGERIRTLDGVDRKLDPADLLIADPRRPLALAGVMGAEDSEVSDSTTEVILESAHFSPSSIAFTSRRHVLRTEASSRFEKGADPEMAPYAAARAARLMVETASARLSAAVIDEYPSPPDRPLVTLRAERTRRLLGMDVSDQEQVDHLRSIDIEVVSGPSEIQARIPTFRPDLTREVDLIEEVARLAGLDRLPATIRTGPGGGLDRDQRLERVVKRSLTGLGLQEVWTSSFSSPPELDALGLHEDHSARRMVRIVNPSSEHDTSLRTTLVPSLLRVAARNAAHRAPGMAAYEVARRYRPSGGALPEEDVTLGLVFSGRRSPKSWAGDEEGWDFFGARGIVEALAASVGAEVPALAPFVGMPFHPTRAAEVTIGGILWGLLGEIHPTVCNAFDLLDGTIAAEIALAPLFASIPDLVTPVHVDRDPPVYIDVAVTVDATIPAGTVEGLIIEAGRPEVASVRLFDLYAGEQVAAGGKSLAFALELRAPGRTMTDEEALAVRDRIIADLAERTGATLRA